MRVLTGPMRLHVTLLRSCAARCPAVFSETCVDSMHGIGDVVFQVGAAEPLVLPQNPG